MIATRTYPLFMRIAAACLTACGVMAAEYHGTVTTSGVPVPGVTVKATQTDNKVGTTADERGQFSFAELADGTWMLEVDMPGFARLTREAGVAHDVPAAPGSSPAGARITAGLNAKSKAVPVSVSVPPGKLQPGRYTRQVNVLNPSEQKFAVWRSPIVLLP